jgi:hypothetical protein
MPFSFWELLAGLSRGKMNAREKFLCSVSSQQKIIMS